MRAPSLIATWIVVLAAPSLVWAQGLEAIQPLDPGLYNIPEESLFADDLARIRQVVEGIEAQSPGLSSVFNETAVPLKSVPATDVGSQLARSTGIESVAVQQRSPISFDPHIRGYAGGQIYAAGDGVFWSPVRRDLDSMLSKLDPSLVRDIVVTPGPYGLRYGPGFGFIDVQTYPTPRYDCYESHARLGVDVETNGGRMFGRATAYGGGADYGYVVNYGDRVGGDYSPGGLYPRIPGSYRSRTTWGQFGIDLSDSLTVELRYLRLDQTDTEYPLQFFDVNYLETDNFALSLIHDDGCCVKWTTTLWYNHTGYSGDTRNEGKRLDFFPVLQRVDDALTRAASSNSQLYLIGETFGDYTSTGLRTAKTYGETGDTQLSVGADFRYLEQHIREEYNSDGATPDAALNPAGADYFYTNQPRSNLIDPGLFAELSLPTTDFLTTRLGARLDWIQTNANGMGQDYDSQRQNSNYSLATLEQSDLPFAFYMAGDLEVDQGLLVTGGFGHAQRVPTLTERYADGLFLGIIQNGFSRVIGQPDLDMERAWQLDLGVEIDQENYRGFLRAYHSWIIDYVTYEVNQISDPTGARLLHAINTDLATLTGFETYGELDLTERLSGFGSASWVYGNDQEIHQPLAQIRPFESTIGLRWHDPSVVRTWGIDFGVRMVARQWREAYFRTVNPLANGTVAPVESETPGFLVCYIRGYRQLSRNLNVVGGIENVFDRSYIEHLDLRLGPDGPYGPTNLLAPGFGPFVGVEWVH